jgi:ATP-dependent helicase HepA
MIRWWLTTRRVHLGLSLDDVAFLTQIDANALVGWAAGIATPSDGEVEALARVLGDPNHPPGAWPISDGIETDALAFRPGAPLGLGRVVALNGEATVEHLLAPGHVERSMAPSGQLVRAYASPQTRCYIETAGHWRAGRVGRSMGDSVEVHFPDRDSAYLPAGAVAVRAAVPVPDPTQTLALKAHETTYFYRARAPFARAVLHGRETATLAGLASAAIHLYPHQVGVVRRVLEDPVRRYLLADEVGLGKTIEAGAVIRQTLLDDPDARILVLVPRPLTGQWREELDRRFDAFARPGRVLVQASDATLPEGPFDLIVVDEAHHLAEVAWSATPEVYERVAALAHAAQGLLLLSATPAFHNEEAFLAMLHLLDPVRYRLDDLEGFRDRVAGRVGVGRALLGLTTTSSAIARKLNLRKVRAFFEADDTLQDLADEVESATGEQQDEAINRLRDYISETHRIYRRMLRTRRALANDVLAVGRGDASRAVRPEFSIDERLTAIDGDLGVWRGRALVASADEETRAAYASTLRILVETAGADLDLFVQTVEARAGLAPPPSDLTAEDAAALVGPPLFEGEQETLDALVLAARETTDETREDLLAMLLEGEEERAVVFASYPGVAQSVAAGLAGRLGFDAVGLVHEEAPDLSIDAIRRFRDDPDCRILVCDRSGEEGLNLQHAGLLVHYDLPLRPNRIEQRTGRLDRIGRTSPMRTRMLLDPEPETDEAAASSWQAWYELLHDGFGVFDRSIADLQFFVQRVMGDVLDILLCEGPAGLIRLAPDLQEQATEERRGLAAQDALDAVDTSGGLQAADLAENPAVLRRSVVPWVRDALHFEEVELDGGGTVFRHRKGRGRETLVPADLVLNRFLPASRRPLAFDRDEAVASEDALPLRAGHPLFDALAAYAEWDDRGRAFAVERTAPQSSPYHGSLTVAFQFDLIVEAVPEGADGPGGGVLQRRADGFLPPRVETVFVYLDGRVVTDTELLDVLSRRFKKPEEGGGDINLHKDRLDVIDDVVPSYEWETRCHQTRDAAIAHLTRTPDYRDRITRAASAASEAAAVTRRVADLWASGFGVADALDAELDVAHRVEIAVSSPRVRVDAAGFWIVR